MNIGHSVVSTLVIENCLPTFVKFKAILHKDVLRILHELLDTSFDALRLLIGIHIVLALTDT